MSEPEDLFTKVVLALMSGRPADRYLDEQRRRRLETMRALTAARRGAAIRESMLIDYQLFHLEADLRWIDHASSRLDSFASAINPDINL